MVRLEKHGDSAVRFIFTDSDHYLYKDGVVDVPVNSLSLVIDESEMVTFKKASTGDPFISFRLDKSNFSSRDELLTFYKENMVGAGGLSEEEVQEMIDAATSGMPSSEVVEQLRTDVNAVSGTVSSHTADTTVHFTGTQKSNYDGLEGQYYIDDSWDIMPTSVFNDFANDYSIAMGQFDQRITAVSNGLNTLSGEVDTKVDTTTYESGQYATAQALNELQENKLDASAYTPTDLSEYWTSGQTQNAINAATSGIPSSQVVEQLRNDLNTLSGAVIDNEYTVSQAINSLNNRVAAVESGGTGGGITSGDVQTMIDDSLDIYWTSAQTQTAIDDAKAYYVDFAAMSVQGITDADWDGLVAAINAHRPILVKVSASNGYVNATSSVITDNVITITGADGNYASTYTFTKNGSNDYSVSTSTKQFVSQAEKDAWNAKVDTSAITSSITSGSTDSEIPTAKATYDAIQAGGGGGATYSAGTNISIDTANTINCTLPMRVIKNTNIDGGAKNSSMSSATSSISYGIGNNFARALRCGAAFGQYNVLENDAECSVGYASKTNYYSSTFGSSGNTLFTVGNGGAGEQVRHNAFEVRQNGDIYFPNTDDTTYQNFNKKPMVRLQDMYAALGGLKLIKLTQAEYDALATKDNQTLYIVVD